jgi:secondary thiamine-phosphate synthase enzyme
MILIIIRRFALPGFSVQTEQKTQMVDVTGQVNQQLESAGLRDGFCFVYVPHTTAGVTVNEGADPAVAVDIIDALNEMVPSNRPYRHAEGNSPAHIKASLIGSGQTILVENGRLKLGTWQRVFFCEFDGPRRRQVWVDFANRGS